jgi:hypothetical protein
VCWEEKLGREIIPGELPYAGVYEVGGYVSAGCRFALLPCRGGE